VLWDKVGKLRCYPFVKSAFLSNKDCEMGRTGIALTKRFEGRLFAEEGQLHFVLDVDPESGFGRVSRRVDGEQQVVEMPIAEIGLRLSSSSHLRLDSLDSADTSNRVFQQTDGWFFATRDGPSGPYESQAEASQALRNYILSVQGTSVSGAEERTSV
jgi:hypothetical protein